MLNQRVAIMACARDCARYLGPSLRNVDAVCGLFSDYRVFIMENDSADNTLPVLQRWSARDRSRRSIVSARYLCSKIPGRALRLGYVRQKLLGVLKSSGFSPEVVVVMDLDDIGAGRTGTLTQFVQRAASFEHWDAAFPRLSYDYAAWTPWPHPQRKHAWGTRVRSSFNGVGVYKGEVYTRGVYLVPGCQVMGRRASKAPCEHKIFHASLGPRAVLVTLDRHAWPE